MRFENLKTIKIDNVEYNVVNYEILNADFDKNMSQLHVQYDVIKGKEKLRVYLTHYFNTLYGHHFYDIYNVIDLSSCNLAPIV